MNTTTASATVHERLERHALTWQSIRRFVIFFPLCLYLAISAIENLPISVLMSSVTIEHRKDTGLGVGIIRQRVTGIKFRSCLIQQGTHRGEVRAKGGVWTSVPFDWHRDARRGLSRAAGWERQSFGTWEWVIDENAVAQGVLSREVKQVRMTVLHRCGANLRITKIGPFTVTDIEHESEP